MILQAAGWKYNVLENRKWLLYVSVIFVFYSLQSEKSGSIYLRNRNGGHRKKDCAYRKALMVACREV